jgi:serine/threonine protein kinase
MSSQLNEFATLGVIGKGSFSKVYKVLRKSDNLIYAMKKI